MYYSYYNYVKPKADENVKCCYMDKNSFVVHVKTDDIYKDIVEDLERTFDTNSNYELEIPLPMEKYKKIIGLMKVELRGKIMKKLVGLRTKAYSYLIDDRSEDKETKDAKKCVIKRKRKFDDDKTRLEEVQIENKINHLEKHENVIDSLNEFLKNNKLMLKTQQ